MKPRYRESPGADIFRSFTEHYAQYLRDNPWQSAALCGSERYPLDGWFPEPGSRRNHGAYVIEERRAIAVCARCPVRKECLTQAIKRREPGIWGGTTEKDRRKVRHLPERVGTPGHQACRGCMPLSEALARCEENLKEKVARVQVPIDWRDFEEAV